LESFIKRDFIKEGMMKKKRVKLITGRTIEQGMFIEHKTSKEYFDATATCFMNERLIKELDIEDYVKVNTDIASIVLRAEREKGIPKDLIFIPMGPWANFILNIDIGLSGMPSFKGVDATIEPTDDRPLELKDLIGLYKG